MNATQDKSSINRMLVSHGLGRLEDGAGLLSQLGFLVQDHEHLRSLLVRCEPENRSAMYDSLKPYLRFTPTFSCPRRLLGTIFELAWVWQLRKKK
jgi:hypothetical protein